jgi:hypothetical protein
MGVAIVSFVALLVVAVALFAMSQAAEDRVVASGDRVTLKAADWTLWVPFPADDTDITVTDGTGVAVPVSDFVHPAEEGKAIPDDEGREWEVWGQLTVPEDGTYVIGADGNDARLTEIDRRNFYAALVFAALAFVLGIGLLVVGGVTATVGLLTTQAA